jgi:valyl-tRNA synthetase
MNLEGFDAERFSEIVGRAESTTAMELSLPDRWILSRLQRAAGAVDQALSEFRFSEAANTLYHFIWGELCDWYIELAKPNLYLDKPGEPAGGGEAQHSPAAVHRRFLTQGTLATVLENSLRLLHPFAPFVTEEIWQKLPKPATLPASLMVTVYPMAEPRMVDERAEREMALLQEVAVAIRTVRSTYSVPPSWSIAAEVRVPDPTERALIEEHRAIIEQSARVTLTIAEAGGAIPQSARQVVRADIEVVVPLKGLVDIDAEKARMQKEIGKAEKEIAGIEKKLANQQFLANAPAEVVEEQRTRLADEESRRTRLLAAVAALGA